MNEIFLQNGKKIWLEVLSVRKFEISTNHSNVEIIRENGVFQEIKFSDLLSFKKGDKITIKDKDNENFITFILNDISRISGTRFEGIQEKVTKSCIFVLPFLGNNHVHFDYNFSLYNVYVSEDYKFIYLKYKFINSSNYLELEEKLQSHPLYQEFFDVNEEYVVFKFKIDEKFQKDVDKIIEGKYSSISEFSKKKILEFHGLNSSSKLGQILSRDQKYKKHLELKLGTIIPLNMDLMSKSSKEEEIWNYQDISQKIGIAK